ncbi:MAG: 30S ribosomal protein S18 [Candidatus Sungbacteria bacterium RIFCSPLOWO2_01_FULL_59_16]|uniref:Small ribosomal subunit protein bS18 n=1 Tax=Candidatus Sungbacteria bacterium RIFCSPLOWO2_01_FULL_59_16 TaxID=1802280 RepID=A0A1G2LDF8_9BACT|nr:MAG: 30S ribosomal protein S18 [Candidatus Sungbacteria bacterium RIFCSPLOWO2_01_FULL_59_16]
MPATEQKQCFFCTSSRKVVDYKDADTLLRFMSAQKKIMPRRRSYLCASHQREFAQAVKRARYLGLVPYTLY